MQIEERLVEDIVILTVSGDLGAENITEASERLDTHLKTLKCRFVFNLSALEIVTSTLIGFLVDAARRTRELRGGTVVSEPSSLFQKTIETLHADEVLKTFPSDNAAVAYFLVRKQEEGS